MSGTWNAITEFQPKDIGGKNTLKDIGIGAGLVGGGIGLAGLAGLGPAAGLFGSTAGAAGAGAAGAGAPLDLLSFGSAAGTATPEAAGAIGSLYGTGGLAATTGWSDPLASIVGGTYTGGGAAPAAGSLDNLATGANSSGILPTGAAPAAPSAGAIAPPAGASGAPLSIDPTAAASGAPGAAPGAAAGATPGASGGFSMSNLISGAEKSITSNPLGLAAAGGGLLYSVMSGKQISAAQQALEQQASQLSAQGQQMASYLSSGTLPAGLKAGLDQATAAAKAKVISNYAAQGMSTDPSQNSTLAQQLALIDQQAIITTAQIGQQLYSSGVQESGLASGLYTTLANLDETQTGRIGQAIAGMASALSPSKGGISLNLGGKTG